MHMARCVNAQTISLGFYCSAMLLAGAGNVDVVMAPVTVVDDKGDAVSGLTKSQFRVFDRTSDKGEALPIVLFEHAQSPMSVVFVVDTSASMGSKVEKAQAALES